MTAPPLAPLDTGEGLRQLQALHLDRPAEASLAQSVVLRMFHGAQTPEFAGAIAYVVLNRYLLDDTISGEAKRTIAETVRVGWRDVRQRFNAEVRVLQADALRRGEGLDGALRSGSKAFKIEGIVYAATPLSDRLGAFIQQTAAERRAIAPLFTAHYAWTSPRLRDDPAAIERLDAELHSLPVLTLVDPLVILGTINDPRYGTAMEMTVDTMIRRFLVAAHDASEVFLASLIDPFAADRFGAMGFWFGLFLVAPYVYRRHRRRQRRQQVQRLDSTVTAAQQDLQQAGSDVACSVDSETTPLTEALANYDRAMRERDTLEISPERLERVRATMGARAALAALLASKAGGEHVLATTIWAAVERLVVAGTAPVATAATVPCAPQTRRARAKAQAALHSVVGDRARWTHRGIAMAVFAIPVGALATLGAGVDVWLTSEDPHYVALTHLGVGPVPASQTGEVVDRLRALITEAQQEAGTQHPTP